MLATKPRLFCPVQDVRHEIGKRTVDAALLCLLPDHAMTGIPYAEGGRGALKRTIIDDIDNPASGLRRSAQKPRSTLRLFGTDRTTHERSC